MNRLREYRERYGLTQEEAIREIHRRAAERGDAVLPGLDQPTLSRHENGHTRPSPRNRAFYCDLYGVDAAALGFRVALPTGRREDDEVRRRDFLTAAAGFVASAALPDLSGPQRLGQTDLDRLRQTLNDLRRLDSQHGSAAVYELTTRTFRRLRGLVEHARYDHATGQGLRALVGEAASRIGWLEFDAGRHEDARRWQLEALSWAQLADADPIRIAAMATMARIAADDRQPRPAVDCATAAQSMAGRAATPRLRSMLAARKALGHAGAHDAPAAQSALRRARAHAETLHADDLVWLAFYGPADLAAHERGCAVALGDLAAAEAAARTAHALCDSFAYPRNTAIAAIELAAILAERDEVDESAAVATQAAVAAADVDSGRVTRGLRTVAARLEPHRANADVGAFLALV